MNNNWVWTRITDMCQKVMYRIQAIESIEFEDEFWKRWLKRAGNTHT